MIKYGYILERMTLSKKRSLRKQGKKEKLPKKQQKSRKQRKSLSKKQKRRELIQVETHPINPMNCSPSVEGKTVSQTSCLTPDILLKIKNKYNEDHKDNEILSKDPREIWTELNNRLTHCKKEDCWLKELDDKSLITEIKTHIFAPEMPKEWLSNPDEWLSNFDIFNVISQYETKYKDFKFMGPTTMDFDTRLKEKGNKCVEEEICNFDLKHDIKKGFKKFGCVVNLDKHWQGGSHWVSLFVDIEHQIIFYFDSAGTDRTPKEIIDLVNRITEQGKHLDYPVDFKFYTNGKLHHQTGNTECGMYSIFFIITMLTGKTPFHKKHILSIKERLDLFLKKRIPDEVIFDYRDLYFNKPDQ
jgi:hypothetical protein